MSHNETETAASEEGTGVRGPLELLAPAGDEAALRAALEAGADAVYLGLMVLNARRRAANFSQEQMPAAVEAIHAHGARAYLTLNIDLAERELEIAARVLELARDTHCDGVLVRDPALFALQAAYPEIEYHWSSQTCLTSSADVAAAVELGAVRGVLARELDLSEIRAASAVSGLQTEVFVQGSLCCSVSGRCLLSSWIGGRSGNRGLCASPCRVAWAPGKESVGTPLSMYDLGAFTQVEELRDAGVHALKIEGRMKPAAWVARAVSVYRRLLSGAPPESLRRDVEQLAAAAGRELTSGHLEGQQTDMTGVAARKHSPLDPVGDDEESLIVEPDSQASPREHSTYELEVFIEEKGVNLCCRCSGITDTWTIPKTVIHRPHKAVSVEMLSDRLANETVHGCALGQMSTNNPEFLLVPRAVNAIIARITKTIQRGQKNRSELVTIKLPESIQVILKRPVRHPGNQSALGDPPDRVRLDADAVEDFLAEVRVGSVIAEGVTATRVRAVRSMCRRARLVVALPPVFFEADIEELRALLHECARANLVVEINSWGGWYLAKEANVRMEAGPGLPVLNSLAAREMAKHNIEAVTLSPEGDRRQFEEATAYCPIATSLYVFGRPPLMISRVELPAHYLQQLLVDRRDNRLFVRKEQGLWVLRPDEPFDLRNLENERIRVKHLVVDLVGSPAPVDEWQQPAMRGKPAFHFNYERGLA